MVDWFNKYNLEEIREWEDAESIKNKFNLSDKRAKKVLRSLEREGLLLVKTQNEKKYYKFNKQAQKEKRTILLGQFSMVILVVIILLFFVSSFVFSLNRGLHWDDLEHLNASWLVANGNVPYLDFFEHHAPLSWYFLSLFFRLFDESVLPIFLIRGFYWILSIISAFLFFKICRIFFNRDISLLGVIILLFNQISFLTALGVRPDQFSLFFVFLSIFFFFRFESNKKALYFSAVSLSISFLFLQKSFLIFFCFLLLMLFKKAQKKNIVFYSVAFILPAIFFILLFFGAHLQEFYFHFVKFNFLYNGYWSTTRPMGTNFFMRLDHINQSNPLLVIFTILSLIYLIIFRKLSKKSTLLFFMISVAMTLFAFTFADLGDQYFLFIIPFWALLILEAFNDFFKKITEKTKVNESTLVVILAIIFVLPAFFYIFKMTTTDNLKFEKMVLDETIAANNFALGNTSKTDLIYQNSFPRIVVRKTAFANYFCTACNNVIEEYDLNIDHPTTMEQILKRNPKLLYFREPVKDDSFLLQLGYNKTPIDKLYIRNSR